MKNTISILILFFTFSILHAQKKEHIIQNIKLVPKVAERGAAIKRDVPVSDDTIPPPPSGLENGQVCRITFDNFTGYWVKIYINGEFKCYVEPWEMVEVELNDGYISYYFETAGSTLICDCNGWSGDCNSDLHVNIRE